MTNQRPVKLRVFATSTYYNSNTSAYEKIDEKTVDIEGVDVATAFPLQVPLRVSSYYQYEVNVVIEGLECSECAAGVGCQETFVAYPNNVYEFFAAKPQWMRSRIGIANQTTLEIPEPQRAGFKAGSCGCEVAQEH